MLEGCERFFRPGYNANLRRPWLPALDGVIEKLERARSVADVGCGHGASTILMAQAFPHSTFVGFDYHAGSIETRASARRGGGRRRSRPFEVAPAACFPGDGYDLVTHVRLPARHGRPGRRRARTSARRSQPDGTWMIVEPFAGDRIEDNLNPVGRAYYGFSTLLCTPCVAVSGSRARARRAGGRGANPRRSWTAGGFTRFRRVAETPFNLVFEARP